MVFQASWAAFTLTRADSSVKGGKGGRGTSLVDMVHDVLSLSLLVGEC